MITPEELRKRIYKTKPKKVEWLKRLPLAGSPTAWLALLLSAFNLFMASLWKHDKVDVFIRDIPVVSSDISGDVVVTSVAQQLLFINSGNRTVSITRIGIDVDVSVKPPDCNSGVTMYYDVSPILIKSGDMATVSFETAKGDMEGFPRVSTYKNGDIHFPGSIFVNDDKDFIDTVCLVFTVVTPSKIWWNASIPLYDGQIPYRNSEMKHQKFLIDRKVPQVIIDDTSFQVF